MLEAGAMHNELPRKIKAHVAGDPSWRQTWFRRLWICSIFLLILSPGRNFGFGNTNPFERSAFLAAMAFFVWNAPLRKTSLAGLLLMLLAILSAGAITAFPEFEWTRLLMATTALGTMLGFLTVDSREEDEHWILTSIAILPLLLVAFSIALYIIVGTPLMVRDHTGAMRLGGGVLPAYLAGACYASVIGAGFLFCRAASWKYIALIGIVLVISMLTGSRMATVCAIASIGPIVITARKPPLFKSLLFLYGTATLAILLFTAGDQLVHRFLSGSSSGRELIWAALENGADRYPLFGVGFGHHSALIPAQVARLTGTSAAHNEILRLRVELGWIGASVFAAGWIVFWLGFTTRYIVPSMTHILLISIFFLYGTTDNVLFFVHALLGPVAIGIGISRLQATYKNEVTSKRTSPSR